MVALLFQNKTLCEYNKATITRHNYSKWQRPGNLKTKIRDFEICLFRIKMLLLGKDRKTLIVNIMFRILKLNFCFSGGSL